jgi:Polyketide cyclase / dehydrase and lipid transport
MLLVMTRWYSLEPADAGFFTTAPHIFRFQKRYPAPPERVWESLTSDASLAAWGPSVSSVTWLSDRPFDVGTTREVALAPGVVKVRERFSRWEAGRGYSFSVYEANVPIFRRFAEDYAVSADGADNQATRFDWTVAIEPKPAFTLPAKALTPILKLAFGRLAADGERYFARTA